MKKRLGDLLVERGLITMDQLGMALGHQRQWGMRLGSALVAKGFISEGGIVQVLAETLKIPSLDLALVDADERAMAAVSVRLCEQYEVFPVTLDEDPERGGRATLVLAMADPLNVTAIDEISFAANVTIRPTIAQISSINQAIRRHYHGQDVVIPSLDDPVVGLVEGATSGTGATRPAAPPVPPDPFMDFSDDMSGPELRAPPFTSLDAHESQLPTGSVAPLTGREPMEALQRNFWALMRVLAARGLIRKDEVLREFDDPLPTTSQDVS